MDVDPDFSDFLAARLEKYVGLPNTAYLRAQIAEELAGLDLGSVRAECVPDNYGGLGIVLKEHGDGR